MSHEEDKMSIAASEDGISSSDAEDFAEHSLAVVAAKLESEAELTAMLLQAHQEPWVGG